MTCMLCRLLLPTLWPWNLVCCSNRQKELCVFLWTVTVSVVFMVHRHSGRRGKLQSLHSPQTTKITFINREKKQPVIKRQDKARTTTSWGSTNQSLLLETFIDLLLFWRLTFLQKTLGLQTVFLSLIWRAYTIQNTAVSFHGPRRDFSSSRPIFLGTVNVKFVNTVESTQTSRCVVYTLVAELDTSYWVVGLRSCFPHEQSFDFMCKSAVGRFDDWSLLAYIKQLWWA